MSELVVMRGVSGSGKSTRAKELVQEFISSNPNGSVLVCSADDFFLDASSGQYNFDSKLLGQAHAWCRGKVTAALELDVDLIVVDNTNTQYWEFDPYVGLAKDYDYKVTLERVGDLDEASLKVYANRNKHGVSLDVIRKQAKRFQE